MTHQEQWNEFLERQGGWNKFAETINEIYFKTEKNESMSPQDSELINKLSIFCNTNPFARRALSQLAEAFKKPSPLGDVVSTPFQASTHTHGASTADDYFKSKSDDYLHNAELHNLQDEAIRNNEDGWPDSGVDIGHE